MFRGYWRYILAAFAGIALISGTLVVYGIESAHIDNETTTGYQPARNARLGLPLENAQVTPHAYEPRCYSPKTREDAELCANWSAVDAAEQANRINSGAFRLSGLAFGALVVSLIFTGWAALAAAQAARAATNANTHSERMAEHELRPYIFMKSIDFEFEEHFVPEFARNLNKGKPTYENPTGQVTYEYTNSGKTPAKFVKISARAAIIHKNARFDHADFGTLKDIGPLGPGDDMNGTIVIENTQGIGPDIKKMVEKQEFQIHICGRIEYTDEWKGERWTTFHSYVGGAVGWHNSLVTHPEGNDYA